MNVSVVREGENEIEIVFEGEDTLVPVVKHYLLEDDDVEIAAFRREHPLTGKMYLFVRTKKGRPRDAIRRALERIRADLSQFLKEFKSMEA